MRGRSDGFNKQQIGWQQRRIQLNQRVAGSRRVAWNSGSGTDTRGNHADGGQMAYPS